MVLKVELFTAMSISIPVIRSLNHGSSVFLNLDPASSHLLAPDQAYTLFSNNGSDLSKVRNGRIRSVNKEANGITVNL